MANEYHKDNSTRISNEFKVNGVLTDPTTVTLKIKYPDDTTSTFTYALGEVSREAAGKYFKDITLDHVGIWCYRWEGTGACEAVDENYLQVLPSLF